ncbi:MAG: carbamoyltransferase [Alphaproteobacteria bacterium]|nr:carbamoyltransferase [Alphaproteobacteria bacterium]
MRIMGLVAATHDSGLALLDDGVPTLVLEEERLNREKRTKAFPRHCLIEAMGPRAVGLAEVDLITAPWDEVKLRQSFAQVILSGLPHSLNLLRENTHTPQRNEIVRLSAILSRRLNRITEGLVKVPPILCIGHHDSHAAAFFVSPFEEANILVMDGFGDDAASSVYSGRGNRIERHGQESILNSIGLVYTFVTKFLGFRGFSDEGKVMALAACGDDSYVQRFRDVIGLKAGGRYAVNMDYFQYPRYGELKPLSAKFYEIFGEPRRPRSLLEDRHLAIAHALQTVTEEVVVHIVRAMVKERPSPNLVMTGGVALNCVANAKVLEQTDVERVWVPPCASDTGAPLGSTLWHWHQTLGKPRGFELTHASYGIAYSNDEIAEALAEAGVQSEIVSDGELVKRVALDLSQGKIAGWFQGRFEMGPRALGNRSILADPRQAGMRDILNAKIKHREEFRPFAPAVLEERAAEFFEIAQPDPFMTLAPHVRREKLGVIPAAVHVDGTGRIQTVSRAANPLYYDLIAEFGVLTGVPVLLNTSFNRHEPIVARPREAISCYLRTGMDVMAIGNHYVTDRSASARSRAEMTFTPGPI